MQLFGPAHLGSLAAIVAAAILLIAVGRKGSLQAQRRVVWGLTLTLIAGDGVMGGYAHWLGLWSYRWALPLQLCDLAVFGVILSLFYRVQWIWELTFFWGIAGSSQALLTPELRHGFPSPFFFGFFATHGGVVAGALYLAGGLGRPIDWRSLKRVWLLTHLYAGVIALFNWRLGTNYLFLSEKPTQATLLDLFGPWPWYLIGLEVLGVLLLLLAFGLYQLIRKRSS